MSLKKCLHIAAAAAVLTVSAAVVSMAAETVEANWSNLYLTTDSASWTMVLPAGAENQVVKRYEIRLDRMRNGVWDTGYRTVYGDGDESSHDINYSTTGKYRFSIRALFYGGQYTAWSNGDGMVEGTDISNTVIVTSDDISTGSGASYNPGYGPGSTGNVIGPGSTGTTTGPGGTSAGPGSTMTGPGSTAQTITQGPGSTAQTVTPSTGTSGWQRDAKGTWYRYASGNYPKATWENFGGSEWYYFDATGYLHYGWLSYNGNWYFLDVNTGKMLTGWRNVNESWYYFNESGIMQTGYVVVNGKVYWCGTDGRRFSGGYNPADGKQYDNNGVMIG